MNQIKPWLSFSFCGVKSLLRAGHAVFVGTAINDRRLHKVAVRRRRGRLPFQGRGLPRIIRCRLSCRCLMLQKKLMMKGICAAPGTRPQSRSSGSCGSCCQLKPPIAPGAVGRGIVRATVRHTAQHAGHALRKHRLENQVHEHERSQKCTLPQNSLIMRPVIFGNQ